MGGQVACRQVTPGKPGCGLPLRGHRGPGPVRASVLLSRVLTEAGGRTCRTPPWACSVSSQSTCWTHCVHLGVGCRHPRPYVVGGVRMDTLGHSDAPAACIVMEGSGRAGPSVKENAWSRKGHAHRGSERKRSQSSGLDPSRCSQPVVPTFTDVPILFTTWFIKLSLGNHPCTKHVHENGTPCVLKDLDVSVYASKELVNGHRHRH